MKKILIVMVLGMMLMTGCATMQNMPIADRSRTYQSDYETTFAAVFAVFEAGGFMVTSVNDRIGLISTEWQQNSTISAAVFGKTRTKASAMVRAIDTETTNVTLTILAEEQNMFGASSAMTMTSGAAKDYYASYLDAIGSVLNNSTPAANDSLQTTEGE